MKILTYVRLAIIALFIILIGVQANKKFVLDEIDFPIVSHAASISGKPIYYRGEQSPVHVGTYHPTLYINSLASFIKVFGYSEATVRFYGAICTLGSAYLLLLIFRLLANKKNPMAETLLLGLFLLNPYTLANTTLPDIDSTILPVLFLLFIYATLRLLLNKKAVSNKEILILGVLFALALWTKLTTPLVLPLVLFAVAYVTSKKLTTSLLLTIKVAVIGGLLFLVTYFLYCKVLGLSTTYTYRFLIDSFTKGTSSDGPIEGALKNITNIRQFLFWPTLPVTLLFGVSSVGLLLENNNQKNNIKKILLATGILVTGFYIALISPFGGFFKYPFPVFGLMILSIALFLDSYIKSVKVDYIFVAGAVIIGALLEKRLWSDDMFINNVPFKGLLLLIILIAVCYVALMRLPKQYTTAALVLVMCFAIGFQTSISRVQATAAYPTKYHYGQKGLDDTTNYLKANTSKEDVIWAMKDVGYYTNNKYLESYGYYFDTVLQQELTEIMKNRTITYYIATNGIGQDNLTYYTPVKQILDTYASPVRQYGDFIIYKLKD